MRYGNWNATWPFAELLIEQGTARVRLRGRLLRRIFRQPLPSIDVPIADATIEQLRTRRGIRFVPGDGSTPVIFWYLGEHQRVLDLLRHQGARIDDQAVGS